MRKNPPDFPRFPDFSSFSRLFPLFPGFFFFGGGGKLFTVRGDTLSPREVNNRLTGWAFAQPIINLPTQ